MRMPEFPLAARVSSSRPVEWIYVLGSSERILLCFELEDFVLCSGIDPLASPAGIAVDMTGVSGLSSHMAGSTGGKSRGCSISEG